MKQTLVISFIAMSLAGACVAQDLALPAFPDVEEIEFVLEGPPAAGADVAIPAPSVDFAFNLGQDFQVPAPPPPPGSSGVRVFVARGSYLGIGVQDVNAERAKELKLSDVRGIEVTRVEEDSPAAKAGLKQGDVVLEFSGQRVEGVEQFMRLVRETPVGREVKLLVSRNGANQTLNATIGERTPGRARWALGSPMDPHWQQEMERLQREMGNLRFRIPDMPQPFMAWRSGVIGVEAETVGSQLADFFGVKKGVLVRSVAEDSAAEKAGLKAGDVIVKVDNQEVAAPSDITQRLRGLESKRTVAVTFVRSHHEQTVNVTIEPRPAEDLRPRRIVAPRATQFQQRMPTSGTSPLL